MGVLLAPLVPSSPATLPILSRRLLLLDSAFCLALAALSAASAAANWPEVIVAVGGFLAALPAAAAAEEVAAAGGGCWWLFGCCCPCSSRLLGSGQGGEVLDSHGFGLLPGVLPDPGL